MTLLEVPGKLAKTRAHKLPECSAWRWEFGRLEPVRKWWLLDDAACWLFSAPRHLRAPSCPLKEQRHKRRAEGGGRGRLNPQTAGLSTRWNDKMQQVTKKETRITYMCLTDSALQQKSLNKNHYHCYITKLHHCISLSLLYNQNHYH